MAVWAGYVTILGAVLAVVPNTLLSLFGIAETDEVWIRIVGILLLILALYYFDAVRNGARHLYVASILGRGFAVAALIVLGIAAEIWQLFLFAAIDLAGSVWTYQALRADAP